MKKAIRNRLVVGMAAILVVLVLAFVPVAGANVSGWADRFIVGTSTVVLTSDQAVWADSPFDGYYSFVDIGIQNRTQAYNAVPQVGWHHASRLSGTASILQTWFHRFRRTAPGIGHNYGDECSDAGFAEKVADGSRYVIHDTAGWGYPHTGFFTSRPGHLQLPHDDQSPNVIYTGAPGSPGVWWEYAVRIIAANGGNSDQDWGCYTIYWVN